MTIPEDIVKSAKENNLSPALTENLIRLHNQQVELEKAVNELRGIQLQTALVIEQQSSYTVQMSSEIKDMRKRIGFSDDENISTEEIYK